MFYGCTNLRTVNTSGFEEMTDCEQMFHNCTSLTEIDMSHFVSAKKTIAMFMGTNLTTVDCSAFINAEQCGSMFMNCSELTRVTSLTIPNAVKISSMFNNCAKLTQIDNFQIDFSKIATTGNYSQMVYKTALTTVNVIDTVIPSPYDGTVVTKVEDVTKIINYSKSGVTVSGGNVIVPSKIETVFNLLDTLLKQLPENTVDTPYDIEITEISYEQCQGGVSMKKDSIGYVLSRANKYKYVGLSFTTLSSDITSTLHMFYDCSNLISLDTSAFINVEKVGSFCSGCTNLKYINTSGLANIQGGQKNMFYNCTSLTTIDTSAFINLSGADYMFRGCTSLTTIDTSAFTNITNAMYMFNGCINLKSIDISAFNKVKNASSMFKDCTSLEEVNGWCLPRTTNTDDIFKNCPESLVVHVKKPTIQDTDQFSLIRLKMNRTSTQITVQGITESEPRTSTLATTKGSQIIFGGKSDEITFGSVSDYEFASMLTFKYIWNYRSKSLDPSQKNFVLWATEGSNVITNIGGGGGSALVPSMTQAQYDKLTEAEKNNGQIREITNAEGTPIPFAIMNDDLVTSSNVLSAQETVRKIDSKVSEFTKYSTEETVVGEWIDGKPIYRKIVNTKTPNSTKTDTAIKTNVADNIETLVSVTGFFISTSSNKIIVNSNFGSEYYNAVYIRTSDNSIIMQVGVSAYVNRDIVVTLEYTKTTD